MIIKWHRKKRYILITGECGWENFVILKTSWKHYVTKNMVSSSTVPTTSFPLIWTQEKHENISLPVRCRPLASRFETSSIVISFYLLLMLYLLYFLVDEFTNTMFCVVFWFFNYDGFFLMKTYNKIIIESIGYSRSSIMMWGSYFKIFSLST